MFKFNEIYLNEYFTVAGHVEKEFKVEGADIYLNDYYFGETTTEKAEAKMQKTVLNNLITNKTEIILGGDLTNQLTAFASSTLGRNIPSMGLYSACATSASSLLTLAQFIQGRVVKEGVFVTSSHNLVAEKQFRFPVEYGSPKPLRSTFTATAAVGITLSRRPSNLKLIGGMLGQTIDSHIKDAHNMGAIMAPSAVLTLTDYLNKTKTEIKDYDLILTGDLGKVGSILFKEILKKEHNINIKNHIDAGEEFYKNFEYAGASGTVAMAFSLVVK